MGRRRRLKAPSLAGRRLLVLGASNHREFAFHTWARLGVRVALMDGFSHQRYERLVDEFGPWDVRDHVVRDRSRLDEVLPEADAITSLHDFTVRTAAALAAAAGRPGPGEEAAQATRDKRLLRAAWQQAGLAVPRWAAVDSAADLGRFFGGRAVAAILKPADLASSAAVYRVAIARQALARLDQVRKLSFEGAGVVEEYVAGPEYSVEAAVHEGETIVAAITSKETAAPGLFLERQHLVPAPLDGADRMALADVTAAAVRAINLRDAVVHAELKLAPDGAVPIELACRPAGGFLPDLVYLASGTNLYRMQAELALGAGTPEPAPFRQVAAVRFLIGRGRVRRFVEPATLARRHPGVVAVNQLAPEGRRIPALVGNWARAGYAIAVGDDPSAVTAVLTEVVGELARGMGVEEVVAWRW